jgi:hypothetical protein
MVYWILKLLVLVLLLVAVFWLKFFVVSDSFKSLYNQFYYLKNLSFYNNYLTSESWLATQRLNLLANPRLASLNNTEEIVTLWDNIYHRIDDYTFIFQYADLMVIDDQFQAFYTKLLSEDNCLLIAEKTVKCDDDLSKQIYYNSFRSSMSYYYVIFKKFNIIFNSTNATNATQVFTEFARPIEDLAALTNISYKSAY